MLPRAMGPTLSAQSCRVGKSPVIFASVIFFRTITSTLSSTSAMPKTPITTGTIPTPSFSSRIPKVKRLRPVIASVPTIPRTRPTAAMIRALIVGPLAR
jgi:hypothetical protein